MTRVVASRVQRWTDVIPRYGPGHDERFSKLVQSSARILPGLHLAGNYVGGVSVDDRLGHGLAVAETVANRLSHMAERRQPPVQRAAAPREDDDGVESGRDTDQRGRGARGTR